jgi:2-succinyl-5-enolpyruvyl-6-hydroxy-3-cyclohexene-1-carboxylate synthase
MTENPALYIVTAFMTELRRAGVRNVCISPGSRSTPLTMAVARHGEFATWTLLDERSAAFFALGVARASGEPVALICTSGTATANYLPAVMEARQSNVPLIVLTADRPPELHGIGSNQTIRQDYMYNDYVKWSFSMPVPEENPALVRHARSVAWRAVAHATAVPQGPVHLNWPLREPLVPPKNPPAWATAEASGGLRHWFEGRLTVADEVTTTMSHWLKSAERGLIVCGPQDDPSLASPIMRLAERWNVPILADPLSQLRTGLHINDLVIDTYDLFLRNRQLWSAFTPDVVVRFGRTPTSKVLGQFLAACDDAHQVVVTDDVGWKDPFFTASAVVQADPASLCEALLEKLDGSLQRERQWTRMWTATNRAAAGVVERIGQNEAWSEGRIFYELSQLLPDGATLFAGNSMPVRDLDDFYLKQRHRVRFLANRGVSGIDGVVSSALGVAAVSPEPVVLVIGDVSFFHDLNGLLAAKMHNLNLLVILVHNDGGGIFSFLPQAAHPDTFSYFRTEHGLDFQRAVEMYGGCFERAEDWPAFRTAVGRLLSRGGLNVLEVRTESYENVRLHEDVYHQVAEAVEELAWPSR